MNASRLLKSFLRAAIFAGCVFFIASLVSLSWTRAQPELKNEEAALVLVPAVDFANRKNAAAVGALSTATLPAAAAADKSAHAVETPGGQYATPAAVVRQPLNAIAELPVSVKAFDVLEQSSRASVYDIEAVQQQRRSAIEGLCKLRKELKRPTPWRYKFDQRHNILYCPIPKSGWSSWKRVFFYVNGAIKDLNVEIGITPDKNASIADMTGFTVLRRNVSGTFRPYSFLFVRDPWQRLLSAYINKALDWNYTRILHTPCEWETMTPYRPPITFEQFLTCIVDRDGIGKRLDIHWTPMWQLCDMCQIRYNTIGHLETIAADAERVLANTGLNLKFPTIFSSQAHKPADVARSWYATLSPSLLHRLQKLYELDFLLHGYSNVPPGWEGRL